MGKALFEISPEKCTMCYSCVRECPVKAIEIKSDRDYAKILPNRCIGCGGCLLVCPEDAVSFRSSKEEVKSLLDSDHVVVAIVAPSVSGEFEDITDYRKFVQMLHVMGFNYVNEVSFGADLIAKQYKELFANFKGKHYLTSNCPVVLNDIEKYHPELIDNLAPIASPMILMNAIVRERYKEENVKVVYIGPCIASKDEALRYPKAQRPDSVLTFVELREMFEEMHISEKKVEFSVFDTPWGNRGSLFPIGNGLLEAEAIDQGLVTGHVVTVEGRNDFLESVSHFESHAEQIRKHFNIFYCDGCIMGPGTSRNGKKYVRRSAVIQYAKKRLNELDFDQWNADIKEYSSITPVPKFKSKDQRIHPNEAEVTRILDEMGKTERSKQNGCASCGYQSCRHLAIAVSKGLAEPKMCLSYSFKNRKEYVNNLDDLNEQLQKADQTLRHIKEKANEDKMIAQQSHETIIALLHELPSAVVIIDENMKIVQSNRNFVKTIGKEAEEINEVIPGLVSASLKALIPFHLYKLFHYVVDNNENIMDRDIHLNNRLFNISIFSIKKHKVVGGILRDMHLPEVQKEQVISRVNEVIEKNLSMVQKIGFLLGEGASETEQMLNSIIESYNSNKK